MYRGVDGNGDTLPYGYVVWNVDQAYTSMSPAAFQVTARDQAGATVTFSWTVVAGTANHLFVSRDSGNDSNDGSYGSPFASLAKVFGASSGTTTYPDKQIWIRGSATAYALSAHSGGILTLNGSTKPVSIRSFPGEDVEIDASTAQFAFDNCADFVFAGSIDHRLTITGSTSTPADAHTFRMESGASRVWFDNIWFKNPVSKTGGSDTNSTSIFAPFSVTPRNYWFINNCLESGRTRTGGANNNMLMHCLFSVHNALTQFCKATQTASEDFTQGITYKDSNENFTVRFCTSGTIPVGSTGSGQALLAMYQNAGGDGEFVGCFIVGGRADINGQEDINTGTGHNVSRCTIYAADFQEVYGIRAGAVVGAQTFTSSNNVVVARTTESTANVTNSGNITYFWNGDGNPGGSATPIDPSTGRLRNITAGTQYRTLYEGTASSKGHWFA